MNNISPDWVAALATVAGIVFIWWQIREARKQTKGQFLLQLDDHFKSLEAVHQLLSGVDEWNPDEPSNHSLNVGRIELNQYMGLFERIEVLIEDGVIDISLFYRLYGYRLYLILKNEVIYMPLCQDEGAYRWQDFISLCKRVAAHLQKKHSTGGQILYHEVEKTEQDFIRRAEDLKLF